MMIELVFAPWTMKDGKTLVHTNNNNEDDKNKQQQPENKNNSVTVVLHRSQQI